MEWLSLLLAAVLFAAACNLDTVILSMGYAVKGVRVSLSHSLIIAALTTLITWASLLLGAGAARVLSGPLPNLLGGLVLVGIGAWFVLDWLRRLGPAGEAEGENRAATLWGVRLPGRRPGGEQRGHRRGRRGVRYRPRLGGPGQLSGHPGRPPPGPRPGG